MDFVKKNFPKYLRLKEPYLGVILYLGNQGYQQNKQFKNCIFFLFFLVALTPTLPLLLGH